MERLERNKTAIHRVFDELFNQRDLAAADELIAPDMHNHAGADYSGPDGMKRLIEELTAAFPDHHSRIEQVVAEGDHVVAMVTFTGTHQGEFRGIPATGKHFEQLQMHLVACDDQGRGVEHWAVRDDLGMLGQLGVLPGRPQT